MLRATPKKSNNPHDEVVDLGDYYFSRARSGVMMRTPRKRKDDETKQEVATYDSHKLKIVWHIANQPRQKIANDTATSVLEYFRDANRLTVRNLSDEVDQLTQ